MAMLMSGAPLRFLLLHALIARTSSKPRVPGHPRHQGEDFPYDRLLSEAAAQCYDRLVKDPSCCLDEIPAAGVRAHQIRRPDTEWFCSEGCDDEQKGLRGEDLFFYPEGANCSSPRMLYVHGGSWMYGSPTELGYNVLGSKLAAETGSVVMLVDYPLIPVGNFSSILDFNARALDYLSRQGHANCNQEHADAPAILVAGDSSGGGSALSLLLSQAKRVAIETSARIAGGFFYSPWTNLKCDTPDYYHHAFAKVADTSSFKDQAAGRVFVGDVMFQGHTNQNLNWFTANAQGYIGSDDGLLEDPIASPFFANERNLCDVKLPPMYFAVGGSESIMGDSVVVAQNAAVCGGEVHLDIYAGMWHVFPMYSEGCGSNTSLWPAQRALNNTYSFVRRIAADARRQSSAPRPLFLAALEGSAEEDRSANALPHTVINYDLNSAPITELDVRLKAVSQEDVAVSRQRLWNENTSLLVAVLFSYAAGMLTVRVALQCGQRSRASVGSARPLLQ